MKCCAVGNLHSATKLFTCQQRKLQELQSSEKNKAAAVHFTTISCEPNTAYKVQGKLSHIFAVCIHVLSKLCTLGVKVLEHSCTLL